MKFSRILLLLITLTCGSMAVTINDNVATVLSANAIGLTVTGAGGGGSLDLNGFLVRDLYLDAGVNGYTVSDSIGTGKIFAKYPTSAIKIDGDNVTIQNVSLRDNADSTTCSNCTAYFNIIEVTASADATVLDSIDYGAATGIRWGILSYGTNLTVKNCSIGQVPNTTHGTPQAYGIFANAAGSVLQVLDTDVNAARHVFTLSNVGPASLIDGNVVTCVTATNLDANIINISGGGNWTVSNNFFAAARPFSGPSSPPAWLYLHDAAGVAYVGNDSIVGPNQAGPVIFDNIDDLEIGCSSFTLASTANSPLALTLDTVTDFAIVGSTIDATIGGITIGTCLYLLDVDNGSIYNNNFLAGNRSGQSGGTVTNVTWDSGAVCPGGNYWNRHPGTANPENNNPTTIGTWAATPKAVDAYRFQDADGWLTAVCDSCDVETAAMFATMCSSMGGLTNLAQAAALAQQVAADAVVAPTQCTCKARFVKTVEALSE